MELALFIIGGTLWVNYEKLKDDVEMLKTRYYTDGSVYNELIVDTPKPLIDTIPLEEGSWTTVYPQEYYDNLPAVEPENDR